MEWGNVIAAGYIVVACGNCETPQMINIHLPVTECPGCKEVPDEYVEIFI